MTRYSYHPPILEELGRHGLRPKDGTPPQQLRDAVRDLYLYEIRELRGSLLRGEIPRKEYASHVAQLRRRYPLLSLPIELWVRATDESA